MKRFIALFSLFTLILILSACAPSAETLATQTAQGQTSTAAAWTQTPSITVTPSLTSTATFTSTPTVTQTLTITSTPTITATPTITLSPTYDFPDVVVKELAHCRYGPAKAYLHAAVLEPGDKGTVRGRFKYSNWLQVKFDKINYFCWVSPSVVDVTGDISLIYYTEPKLEKVGSNMYGPPQDVYATRDGNMVTISWNQVVMTLDDDRGYFIEAWVCQEGVYKWWVFSYPDQYTTSYTVQDDPGCSAPSRGEIRTVEKHGYSDPVPIPWP